MNEPGCGLRLMLRTVTQMHEGVMRAVKMAMLLACAQRRAQVIELDLPVSLQSHPNRQQQAP